jgi:EAL domain-containing protein (putative c-di-GMP-specific phosphodiesterase class I)
MSFSQRNRQLLVTVRKKFSDTRCITDMMAQRLLFTSYAAALDVYMNQFFEAEQQRLAAVRAVQWLETANSENFDRICRLAAAYFDVPTVLVSLVDQDRQWFAAQVGFEPRQTPISHSFCAHTIQQDGVFQVVDACTDPRFMANPLVTAGNGIRFYAGAPLVTREGHAIGSLCIIDKWPQQLSHAETLVLQDLAEMVIAQIEQRQQTQTRHPVSGMPNLRQLITDHAVPWSSVEAPVRLLAVIEVVESQWAADLTPDGSSLIADKASLITQKLQVSFGGDLVAYHIDERHFCLLLPTLHSNKHAVITALGELVCEPCPVESISALPGVRLGIASCEDGTQSIGELLRKGRSAVGRAGRDGIDWAVWDENPNCAPSRAHSLIHGLAAAMRNCDLFLVFQPRFRLSDGRQVSAEALLRWNHPQYGPVSPAEFIPLIERSGQISIVTRWVIDNALANAATWQDTESKVSLNLSALDFQHIDLTEALRVALAKHGVNPRRLEVEITEGEWIRASATVLTQLSEIRALGVDVAIDDFGTGYSNFAYLHEIPANVIKLDKSIITDLENKPRNRIIAQSIFQLAHSLGYRTVAEGIETFKCMDLVKGYGCQEAQGFFLSRPLSAEMIKSTTVSSSFLLSA